MPLTVIDSGLKPTLVIVTVPVGATRRGVAVMDVSVGGLKQFSGLGPGGVVPPVLHCPVAGLQPRVPQDVLVVQLSLVAEPPPGGVPGAVALVV